MSVRASFKCAILRRNQINPVMMKRLMFLMAVGLLMSSCVRIEEVPRPNEPSEPSDTLIVSGWCETDTVTIVFP